MDDRLIEENLALVRSVAARFAGLAEPDDLFQVGAIGLIKAAHAYDPAFGTRFSTYAFPAIAGEIMHFLRSSRENAAGSDACAELIPSNDDTEEEAINRAEISELMSTLDGNERRLIELRFFRSLTQKETARLMNVSQPYVSRAEKRILDKLRRLGAQEYASK